MNLFLSRLPVLTVLGTYYEYVASLRTETKIKTLYQFFIQMIDRRLTQPPSALR